MLKIKFLSFISSSILILFVACAGPESLEFNPAKGVTKENSPKPTPPGTIQKTSADMPAGVTQNPVSNTPVNSDPNGLVTATTNPNQNSLNDPSNAVKPTPTIPAAPIPQPVVQNPVPAAPLPQNPPVVNNPDVSQPSSQVACRCPDGQGYDGQKKVCNVEILRAFCPMISAPVCGCDGVTYENSCLATQAGIITSTPRPCAISQ